MSAQRTRTAQVKGFIAEPVKRLAPISTRRSTSARASGSSPAWGDERSSKTSFSRQLLYKLRLL